MKISVVYLYHFSEPVSDHASHYLGFTDDLDKRDWLHQHGKGARLLQVAKERGIKFWIVRTWPGDRKLERKLKNRKHAPALCPVCAGAKALNRAKEIN